MPTWFNSSVRLALYGVVGSVIALLLAYKIVDPQTAPLWADLAGKILGVGVSGTAIAALVAQRRTGEVEPTKNTPRRRKVAKKAAPK